MPANKTPNILSQQRDERRFSPSAERNRVHIYDVIKDLVPAEGLLFEVASGTGDHASWIGPQLAPLIWQTSEYSPEMFPSINSHISYTNSGNLRSPHHVDVTQKGWNLNEDKQQEFDNNIDLITCVNMVHISPWTATLGLMSGAADFLKKNGVLYLYGPFIQNQIETAFSNIQFDISLRQRNSAWGIRKLEDVQQIAKNNDLTLEKVIPMPANNLSLIFRKTSLSKTQTSSLA
ncbi:DUF938 domain-containing protein [Kiloniella antarctica]|uniref:DUF938 domain-containing protein n=1 Tax=Kiloniella antarctica TaxID=1550907 RepID=A0ABW5BGD6_9PROT